MLIWEEDESGVDWFSGEKRFERVMASKDSNKELEKLGRPHDEHSHMHDELASAS